MGAVTAERRADEIRLAQFFDFRASLAVVRQIFCAVRQPPPPELIDRIIRRNLKDCPAELTNTENPPRVPNSRTDGQ